MSACSMRRRVLAAMRLGGVLRCCSEMLPSTAQTWTWASVSPGMRVRPLRESVSTRPLRGPTLPERITSLIRSPSMTTAAPSTGSLPVQSIRNASVSTVMAPMRASMCQSHQRRLAGHHLRLEHPDLLVGARAPLDPAGDAVDVVLLPEKDPRDLIVHHLLDLRPRLEPLLRVHDRHGLGDLGLQRLVAAVGGVGRGALQELLDGALGVQRGPPAEEEHVACRPVLDLVEMGAPLVHHHVDLDAEAPELGGDGQRDVLVERVAARGRVQRELELGGVEPRLLEE